MKCFLAHLASAILAFGTTNSSVAEPPAATVTPVSPFEPIAFLVGGVWRAQLPPNGNGTRPSIELRCDWSANHQGIRFDGTVVVNGKRAPYTSGIYNWNAAKRQLVFVYSDAEGNLTEGAIDMENGALIHNFTVTDVRGKIEKARAIITPKTQNTYTNEILVEKNGSLQRLVSVDYARGEK
jgi:hypothetical protein